MEFDLDIEVKHRGPISEDALNPYYIIVRELFEEVVINKYILGVNDKEEEFPYLFSRIVHYNQSVNFEDKFIGWCKIDENMREFLVPTKMKDINSYVSEFIYSFRKQKFFIRIYLESV